jgi:hypothetical protein
MSDVPLPRTPADVSPPWLTRALQADVSGVEVAAFFSDELHDGTAVTSRLSVEYAVRC